MGFQKTINLDPAIGMPGAEVNPGQAVYTAFKEGLSKCQFL